jgi:hypothetical protein
LCRYAAAIATLMNESRGEVRAANLKLLTSLAHCLGRDDLVAHAGAVSAAAAAKLEDTLFGFSGGGRHRAVGGEREGED